MKFGQLIGNNIRSHTSCSMLRYQSSEFLLKKTKKKLNSQLKLPYSDVVFRRFSAEKVFWKYMQASQESSCATILRPATLLKKRLWHKCFPAKFPKFLRTSIFIEHHQWLLLHLFDFENLRILSFPKRQNSELL